MAFLCRKWPQVQSLVDAYIETTGRPVSYTLQREIALKRIHDAGYTPADLVMVMQTIEWRVNKGLSGYTTMSLSFANAVEKFERFEDLLLDVRAKLARRKSKAATTPAPAAAAVAPISEADAERIAAEAKKLAADFRRKMGREG